MNSSYAGTSSNRANPFVMLSRPETTEDQGEPKAQTEDQIEEKLDWQEIIKAL